MDGQLPLGQAVPRKRWDAEAERQVGLRAARGSESLGVVLALLDFWASSRLPEGDVTTSPPWSPALMVLAAHLEVGVGCATWGHKAASDSGMVSGHHVGLIQLRVGPAAWGMIGCLSANRSSRAGVSGSCFVPPDDSSTGTVGVEGRGAEVPGRLGVGHIDTKSISGSEFHAGVPQESKARSRRRGALFALCAPDCGPVARGVVKHVRPEVSSTALGAGGSRRKSWKRVHWPVTPWEDHSTQSNSSGPIGRASRIGRPPRCGSAGFIACRFAGATGGGGGGGAVSFPPPPWALRLHVVARAGPGR